MILPVLVLAGMPLIFFIVASIGICIGFLLKTMLIIEGYFQYCLAVLTHSEGLFWSAHPLPASRLGGLKSGGDTARAAVSK